LQNSKISWSQKNSLVPIPKVRPIGWSGREKFWPLAKHTTQCEWGFEYDGEVFIIYDWKEYRDPKLVTEWHIGGRNTNVVNIVKYFATDKMVVTF
jgi:hypothetical protein